MRNHNAQTERRAKSFGQRRTAVLPLLVILALPACLSMVDGSIPEQELDPVASKGGTSAKPSGRGGSTSSKGGTGGSGTTIGEPASGASTGSEPEPGSGEAGAGGGDEPGSSGGAQGSGGSPSSGSGGSGGSLGGGGSGGASTAGTGGTNSSGGTGGKGGSGGTGGSAGKGGSSSGGTGGTGGSGGSNTTGGTGGSTTVPDNSVPNNAYCSPVANWDAAWSDWENEVLVIVNQRRTEGATCGTTKYNPAGPLKMDPALRCAARNHSLDMSIRDFFDHVNPDGENPKVRIDKAGFDGNGWGENIAGGQRSPAAVMDTWMKSSGHCKNIMNPSFKFIGVGYHPGGEWGHLWTQAFGS